MNEGRVSEIRQSGYPVEHSEASSSQQGLVNLPKIAILLCTYQGQRYLADQLDSFQVQTYTNWEVWASDDGSKDDTHYILNEYKARWASGRLSIHYGPEEGFAANFLSLSCNARISADFYAYSDQDDIWEADKLQRAMAWLQTIPESTPALYCSRTRVVDASNKDIGFSPVFGKPPSFANALIQNIGGGNTMVFNNAARNLLCEARDDADVVSHDWWAYMVISGCGGVVHYDAYPSVRYRQHGTNLVGSNFTWMARFARIRQLWQGRFRKWNDRNVKALQRLECRLTPENREILQLFSTARNRWLIPRLIGLKKSGIYRQTLLGSLGLVAAAILKKI